MELLVKFFERESKDPNQGFQAPQRRDIVRQRLKEEKQSSTNLSKNIKEYVEEKKDSNFEDLFRRSF